MLPTPYLSVATDKHMTATVWATTAAPPSAEDLALIMHRVAALERDVVKTEALWDKDKGQRVIEVWMGLLKKTTFKPSNW